MRVFIFKILIELAALAFPCKVRRQVIIKLCKQQVDIYKRDQELSTAVRPRTKTGVVLNNFDMEQ